MSSGLDLAGRRIPALAVHASAACGVGLMLVATGQPILAEDTWWHLALGRFFAAEGPRLAGDPLLFDAAGPAPTAAWLWEVGIAEVAALGGFEALRALHVAWVAAILALAASLLRRASGSAVVASAGVIAFIALSAYRLVQLRPHLFSMLALLVLHRLLVERREAPSALRIGLAAALTGVWVNAHAAFPLAFLHLGAATLGALAAGARDASQRARAARLGVAGVVACLAILANPAGLDAIRPYFASGVETPALGNVVDEWQALAPWRLPVTTLPPSWLAWGIVWAVPLGVVGLLRRSRATGAQAIDPALVGVAALGLALQVFAVRFLWLGIFPLLLLAAAWRRDAPRATRLGLACAAPLAVLAFVRVGDWPMISRGISPDPAAYARPYHASKHPARAIGMLRDAGLRGNLYTEYTTGGFAGYWLAPGMRTLYNGSMNFSRDAALAMGALAERRGVRPGESFPALLDRLGVDVFLGVRPPEVGPVARPFASTLAHLEGTPGWIPIHRSPVSALYLRDDARNRENLERIARYYAERHVPFDRERGFDVGSALDGALAWCSENGVVPEGFARLEQAARAGDGRSAVVARDRVASLYAVLGLYERAVALDRETLRDAPQHARARRRLVWSLLRLRRFDEAREAALPLADRPEADGLSRHLVEVAARIGVDDAEATDALLARLPFLYRSEVPRLLSGLRPAEVWPALGSGEGLAPDASADPDAS